MSNKVFVLQPVETITHQGFNLEAGGCYSIPIRWADTANENLINKFKEVALRLDDEFAQLDPATRITKLHSTVNNAVIKSYMRDLPYAGQYYIDEAKKMQKTGRPWHTEHIENGVRGWHALDLAEHEPMDLTDLIRAWGYSKLLIAQIAR